MQIHEITRRRTDEGIVSGLQAVGRGIKQAGAIAGGVANYAANAH
jgi:hypothetical protein